MGAPLPILLHVKFKWTWAKQGGLATKKNGPKQSNMANYEIASFF
jgi:hypothetical protein